MLAAFVVMLCIGSVYAWPSVGRLTWGALSDHWSASLNVFMALLLQGVAIAPPYLG